MKVRATYRLQFNCGFTFADAERIVPYLDDLGVSHVYASPVTAAQPGSSHGYDVVDPTRVNPELGGEAGLRRFAGALRSRGMGIVLDIVPNHMSVAGGANRWWNDVLAKGRDSAFARFFDIDWTGRILLPFLGEPLAEAIAQGALRAGRDADGRLWIVAYGHDRYPVRDEDQEAGEAGDLASLLDRQHYRLACWRSAAGELNWRRFFTISGLAGIRVEDEQVFEATHALYFRLADEGLIDGLRIDHVDGLADPGAYCRRLRARLPDAWIVIEKILAAGERLPPDWGVDGTSGYDFMEQVALLLHHPLGEGPLARYWARLSGRSPDFAEEELCARREILAAEFPGQLRACAQAFQALRDGPAPSEADIDSAVEHLLRAFPAYRTYGAATDAPILEAARRRALALAPPDLAGAVGWLVSWLAEEGEGARGSEALRRFRQLSAPLAAKAVEDTAFYRYGRLLSRNDVGSDPSRFSMAAQDFHAAMAERSAGWPRSMLATATHDHKRGEDVRARLAVLSELPELWIGTVERWRAINRGVAAGVDPGDEYQFYQMLVGAWPPGIALDESGSSARADLRDRLSAWLEKALREARLRSSWNSPDLGYEGRCKAFVAAPFDPGGAPFLAQVQGFVESIRSAGEANSLVQAFLRCAAPGVPDCYQGCEFLDLSLVDPDNRRPVDFGT
ncbi:MAG TPA: malto-oligosyltrehalose synthase, partial [Allosphingosinicella sp.]|nr:malto-oligosyltrehalose synthase [Allosphingosinicella sp.]